MISPPDPQFYHIFKDPFLSKLTFMVQDSAQTHPFSGHHSGWQGSNPCPSGNSQPVPQPPLQPSAAVSLQQGPALG